jgi:hypothetical protein
MKMKFIGAIRNIVFGVAILTLTGTALADNFTFPQGVYNGEPSLSVYHQLTPHEGIETPAERINAGVASTG